MQHFPETPNQFGLLGHWNGARDVLTSFLGPIIPNDPQIPTIFSSMTVILMIMAVQVLVTIHWISCHLVRPFKEWFISNIL